MGSNNQLGEQSPNPVVRKDEGRAVLNIQSGLAIAATRRKDKQFHNLYPLLWRREWLNQALKAVLDNTGAKTSGVDGMCGADLHELSARVRFVEELRAELKQRTYHPSPVLRKYIPKANGGERPIGIPTLKDRTVQMVLKMVLEPIFEADFLPNSNGFRPERSTLECVLPMYRYGDSNTLYEWVIEGDIEGCFDNIDHRILMEALQKRIADHRVLCLIRRFLKAPAIEKGTRVQSKKGTPQGGILSPLLANIYLNKFDQFWYQNWGRFTRVQNQDRRRRKGLASCVLFRYADDFVLSVKGTREQAAAIMGNTMSFFKEELKLSLSTDKTRVVSLEDGFDFLGFHIQRVSLDGHKCVRIRPTQRNLSRLKNKLQAMLGPAALYDDSQTKIAALNRVLRGWVNYFKEVNSFEQFRTGDFLAERLFRRWYCDKYKVGIRKYLATMHVSGQVVFRRGLVKAELFRMASTKSMHSTINHKLVWKYRSIMNPYISPSAVITRAIQADSNPITDVPVVQPINPRYDETYLINRLLAFERDGWKCTKCGSQENLQAHHIEPVPKGTFDAMVVHRVENLQTLCADCHRKLARERQAEVMAQQ